MSFEDFIKAKNFKDRNSVSFCQLQIGELCKSVSVDLKQKFNNVRWKDWIFVRNFMAHNYEDFSLKRIWKLSKIDVPNLFKETTEILADLDRPDPPHDPIPPDKKEKDNFKKETAKEETTPIT
jgi:uncharacterized protein with HEPN domain